ncbi:MAG: 30S ribosomal protein S17 [Candidatus Doudnabacteria bacterium]|nr:30S ribosomal protein S17 [Candidatus Doudnabacteria bacterium]
MKSNMQEAKRKKIVGTVTSAKMAKTVVVLVEVFKVHPKYFKRFRKSMKFAAHNEIPDLKTGDKVVIEESKPYSKTVHWRVVEKISN